MKRIADYEVVRELGSGNGGSYWLARTPARLGLDDEFCALKVLAVQASGDAVERLVAELRRFAAVDTPHLVRFLDAGQEGPTLFFASEFQPNGSIAQHAGRVAPATVIQAIGEVARAAHTLHNHGLVHRNIRPSNVLLMGCSQSRGESESRVPAPQPPTPPTRSAHIHHLLEDFVAPNHPLAPSDPPPIAAPARINGPVRAVLTDPGLAHVLAPGAIVTGLAASATLAYLEPDLVRGCPAGPTSDIWGLAVTLHQALTGATPFPDLPTGDLGQALIHLGSAEPVIRIEDPDLADLVRQSLAPDRSQRPPSAAQFADALSEVRP